MDSVEYRRNVMYDPITPYIWVLLDRLDKHGLLKPRLRPSFFPKKQKSK